MSKYWDGEFMSDDKKHSGKIKEIQLSGKVVKKRVAKGSKSEREAILLQTKDTEYILRKWGGNPFRDASLEMLTGKQITATGILDKNLFLVKDIRVEV